MKKSNLYFESVIMVITVVMGVMALFNDDMIFLFLFWLIPFGAMQIIHSLILASAYWQDGNLKTLLAVYWIVAGIDLCALLAISSDMIPIGNETFVILLLVVIVPLMLATLLWGITFCFIKKTDEVAELLSDTNTSTPSF